MFDSWSKTLSMLASLLLSIARILTNPVPDYVWRIYAPARLSPWTLKSFCTLVVLASVFGNMPLLAAAENSGGVTGGVFLDKNGNGIRDRDEPGFAGVVVTLFGKKSDGSSLYLVTHTDSEGKFVFPGALIGHGSSFTVSTGGAPLAATIPHDLPPGCEPSTRPATATTANPGSRERPFRTIGHAVPYARRPAICSISARESTGNTSPARDKPLGGGSGWDRPHRRGRNARRDGRHPAARSAKAAICSSTSRSSGSSTSSSITWCSTRRTSTMPLKSKSARRQRAAAEPRPPDQLRTEELQGFGRVRRRRGPPVHQLPHSRQRPFQERSRPARQGRAQSHPGLRHLSQRRLGNLSRQRFGENGKRQRDSRQPHPRQRPLCEGGTGIGLHNGLQNLVYDNVDLGTTLRHRRQQPGLRRTNLQ